ncbi:MAG: glycosyltransferase family 2 protein [Clostridia bacterium]|nr:glycosyltransferase family 2 protein [Clostridia bacterium]
MFTISLCMIVKNESQTLPRILNCAKQFCDEIIIVDTGSTDTTKEIALSYTDKVFSFRWNDNFSNARNYAFEHATCDYQMWLDADDFISQKEIEKIVKLKKTTASADVFMFNYATTFDENNNPTFVYQRERLLKRTCNFKWQGFVHEAITPSGKIEQCDITIEHRKERISDPKRNLRLYQKAKKRGVRFSPREQYYYARELYYNSHISSAIKNLKVFLKQPNLFEADHLGAVLLLGDCLKNKNQIENAINVFHNYIKSHTPTAELCCKLANLFELNKNIPNALFWYESALICEKQTFGFVQKDYEQFIPFLELSRLYFFIDFCKAKFFHEKAKAIRPKHPSVVFNEQFFRNKV